MAVPLFNVGAVTATDTSKLNVLETFSVRLMRGNRRGTQWNAVTNASGGSDTFEKPADFIGTKTFPDYAAYAATHIYDINIPGCDTAKLPALEGGAWTQVSRLGVPLVNEVVIGLRDKDRFNASEPKDDAQFADYVTSPTLPALLEVLFGAAGVSAPTRFPRADLVAAFLTGVDGVNKNGSTAEMQRLNTALPATPKGMQNSLGAAACFVSGVLTLANPGRDPAGFPNGRRPGDDTVDIALRVAMGYLLPAADAPSGQLDFTDASLQEDAQFDAAFPYLRTPNPGAGGQ